MIISDGRLFLRSWRHASNKKISLTLNMTVFLVCSLVLTRKFHTQRKWTYRLSCHNIFAREARCFASTLQLHLLRNYPAPKSSRHQKKWIWNPRRLLSSDYIIFFSSLCVSAFKLFNSVCPHFPPPFTSIMWLTPTKRIDRYRESCGSLRIAECARLRHGSE